MNMDGEKRMKPKIIVTHSSPDFDAIAFAWLVQKFAPGFERSEIRFLPLNNFDQSEVDTADAVGDMGRQYNPDRLRFDHHHLPGGESTSTCATKMAWEWLLDQGIDLEYLYPLVDEIHRGDLAQVPLVGIHSQLFGWKAYNREAGLSLDDYQIYAYGVQILNQIEFWLKHKAETKAELDEKVVWRSEDGLVWALRDGSTGNSFAAYDEGARIVVYEGEPVELEDGTITYPVGVTRSPEWQEPHIGSLVENIMDGSNEELKVELSKWYRHNAGFFAGRGGPKAPDARPLEIDVAKIALAIYAAWEQ